MKLYYGILSFNIIPPLTLSKSSKEVVYSNIEIDFTGYTLNDLPKKYQKIEIKDVDMNVIYTGYTDEIITPNFSEKDGLLHLGLSVLSPQSYATKRLIDYNYTGSLTTILTNVCQPLVDDGYVLNLDIEERDGSVESNYYSIEKVLTNLSKKYHLWWYIDELLNIYIKDIKKIEDSNSVYTIDNTTKITNLKSTIDSNEYCNKIVAKNVYVYQANLTLPTTNLVNGETYDFNYPIHVSEIGAKKLKTLVNSTTILLFDTTMSLSLGITYNRNTGVMTTTAGIGYLGEDGNDTTMKMLLVRDQFITNKITGFKWVGANDTLSYFATDMALKPFTVDMINTVEINNSKGIVSPSGIMEKIIDLNGKYFEEWELIEYIRNLFSSNKTEISEVNWDFKDTDALPNLKIGDKVTFNLNNYLVSGDFIITNEEKSINNLIIEQVNYSARNINLTDDYLDIFRSSQTQEDNESVKEALKSFYIEETTNEVHILKVDGVEQ